MPSIGVVVIFKAVKFIAMIRNRPQKYVVISAWWKKRVPYSESISIFAAWKVKKKRLENTA
jgi:hypothetical protein